MPIAKRSLVDLAANPPPADRARIAATNDREIDRQIAEDEDTAPDVTNLGAGRVAQPGVSGTGYLIDPDIVLTTVHVLNIKDIRERLNMTQEAFATTFGFIPWTVRQWKQGRRVPTGPARTLLTVIKLEPDAVRRALDAVE